MFCEITVWSIAGVDYYYLPEQQLGKVDQLLFPYRGGAYNL